MEYQFIKDPIDGFRLLITDEHTNIARWLSDETPVSSTAVKQLIENINSHSQSFYHDYQINGKEMVLTVCNGEVAIKINHHGISEQESERFTQEMLSVDTSTDICECGLDDFICLLQDWHDFLKDNRA